VQFRNYCVIIPSDIIRKERKHADAYPRLQKLRHGFIQAKAFEQSPKSDYTLGASG
jgi:hypothetical protein